MSFFKKFIQTVQQEYFQVEPFLDVIRQNDIEKFNTFMKEKVTSKNINSFNNQRVGALSTALEVKNREMIEKLLKKGANPNFRNFEDETVFLSFSKNILSAEKRSQLEDDRLDLAYDKLFSDEKLQPVSSAKYEKEGLDILKLLQMYGADIHAKDRQGNNALMHCIEKDCQESASYLLSQGISPFIKNKEGISALSLAIKEKRCIQEIIDTCQSKADMSLVMDEIKNKKSLMKEYGEYVTISMRRFSLEESLPKKTKTKRIKI